MIRRFLLAAALIVGAVAPATAQSLPAPACAALQALEQKHGALNQGTDDQRRAFALIVAEQFAFSFPGEGWGTKSADPGRPQTKDAVARLRGATLDGWDLVDGGTRRVTCNSHIDLQGQNFIAVTPRNHLDDAPPPPDTPPPTPTGLTVIERVTALQGRMEDAMQALAAQDRKIDAIQHQLEVAIVALEHAQEGIKFPVYTARIFGQPVVFSPKQ
jgi:hypothetical protein